MSPTSSFQDLVVGFTAAKGNNAAAAAMGRKGGATSYHDLARGAAMATRKGSATTHLGAKRERAARAARLRLSPTMKAASVAPELDGRRGGRGIFKRMSNGLYNMMPQKVKDMLDRYFMGLKKLLRDFGEAFQLWRRVRELKRHGQVSLTWREKTLLRRMPVDMMRMLPIAFNPIPPPFGLSIPLMACLFPRLLLTHQFHSAEEAAVYAWQSHSSRHGRKYQALRALLSIAAMGPDKNPLATMPTMGSLLEKTGGREDVDRRRREEPVEIWQPVCVLAKFHSKGATEQQPARARLLAGDANGGEPAAAEDESDERHGDPQAGKAARTVADFFEDNSGALGLQSLPREHLLQLTEAWVGGSSGVKYKLRAPLRFPLRLVMPTPVLRSSLNDIAAEIAKDDKLLRAHGDLTDLTMDELEHACKCRGLTPSLQYAGARRRQALQRRLQTYLAIRDEVTAQGAQSVGARAVESHHSLVLHLPALLPDNL